MTDYGGPTGAGFFLNAAALFDIAAGATHGTRAPLDQGELHNDLSVIAIVFAAASLEAFINEAGAIAKYLHAGGTGWGMVKSDAPRLLRELDPNAWRMGAGPERFMHIAGDHFLVGDPPIVHKFAELLDELESGHASIKVKYLLALSLLSGVEHPRGTEPYQSFDVLVSIRDAIMHSKREAYDTRTETDDQRAAALLRRLERLGVVASPGFYLGMPFLSRLATPSVAIWACNVAARMVRHIISTMPEGDLRNALDAAYRDRFSEVPPR